MIDVMPTTSRPRVAREQRICIIDGWRELPDDRPQVCQSCQSRMDRQLDLLGRVVDLLDVVAAHEPTTSGQPHMPIVDLALPGNPVIVGDPTDQVGQTPIAARLASWAEDWSGRDVWSADARSVAGFLRRGLRWACASHPAIDEFAAELRQAYAAAKRALGRDMRATHYRAPCPHCRGPLVRYPGADWIECGPCERLWDENDYPGVVLCSLRRWTLPGRALTASEAAALAGVRPGTMRQWINRGKVAPDIGPWGDPPRYLRIEIDWAMAIMEDIERITLDTAKASRVDARSTGL